MNKNGKRKLAVMLIMAIFVSACSKQVNENSSVTENPSERETQTSVSVKDDVETIMTEETEEERSVYFFLRGNESAGPKLSVEKRMDLIQYTFVLYTPAEDDTKNEGRRSQKSVTEVFEKDGETQYVMTYKDGSRIDIPPAHLELGYLPDGVKRNPGDTSKYEKEGENLGISPMLIMMDQEGTLAFPVEKAERYEIVDVNGKPGYIMFKPEGFSYDKEVGIFFDDLDYLLVMYLGSDFSYEEVLKIMAGANVSMGVSDVFPTPLYTYADYISMNVYDQDLAEDWDK
ncbi:MAG: hypothetical protein K6A81_07970 [Clostridiales bacterium]|nr:hypothetical protein [Clostridiales bacterium]